MFFLTQIAVALLIIIGITYYFGKVKKKEKTTVAALAVCVVISSVISTNIVDLIPLPTEQVTITATGEKNEEASQNEIGIKALCISGEQIDIPTPVEGKWFWKGDTYMWRNENDPRQPDGITKKITLAIPIGTERYLELGASKWCGIAEVTYKGETTRIDCFNAEGSSKKVADIPDTELSTLLGAYCLRIIIFVAILALLLIYPVLCALKYDYAVLKNTFVKHWDKLLYICIAIFYIAIMQSNSAESYFYGDEIYELGWKYTQYPYDTNYIYYYLSKLWLYIMPYGQENLLLLSQLLVGGTIYLAGLIGNQINGKRLGILSAVLTATSLSIVYQCSLEFRIYPFTLIATALVLYMFVRKQKSIGHEKVSDILIYGLSLAIAMDMHVFCFAIVGLLMVSDFVFILIKKSSRKCWLEFIFPVIYGVWWFIFYFISYFLNSPMKIKWGKISDLSTIKDTLTWLQSSSEVLFALLLFGAILLLVSSINKIHKKEFNYDLDYIKLSLVLVPTILILVIHIYSNYINPENPMFADRYFIAIVIFLIVITAIAIDELTIFFENTIKNNYIRNVGTGFAISLLCFCNLSQIGPTEIYPATDHTLIHTFKQTADYLMSQNDIYCDDTIYIADMNMDILTGYYYYLTNDGKRDMINVVNKLPKDLEQYNVIYCSYLFGNSSKIKTPEGFELAGHDTNVKVMKFKKVK